MSSDVVNSPFDKSTRALSGVPSGRTFVGLCVAAALCLAIVFSAAGAYDTKDLDPLHRLVLWITVMSLVIGQTVALQIGFARLFGAGRLAQVLAGCSTVLAINMIVALQLHGLKYTWVLPKNPDPIPEFVLFVAPAVMPVAGIVVLLSLTVQRLVRAAERKDSVSASEADDNPPACLDWSKTTIQTVRAFDHYLEITSTNGRHFVRGRMKDAEAMLDKSAGLRVHRSWWVNRDAIRTIETKGRDKVVCLQDGRKVPVARSRIAVLREMGWVSK